MATSVTIALVTRITSHTIAAADHGDDDAKELLGQVPFHAERLISETGSRAGQAVTWIGQLLADACGHVDEQGRAILAKIPRDVLCVAELARLERELGAYAA